ncbi:HD domain-containing protein, partial [bacterium]|nr:HD domain-containing protein [bacterium]
LGFLDGVIEVVRQHHERYNGKGYPDNKQAGEIRIEARIMAVADAFDAMTTERPYARALTKEEAIGELKKESGKQFDPSVVEAFLRVLGKKHEWGIKTKANKFSQ